MIEIDKYNCVGCDDLRDWLIRQGFKIFLDKIGRSNECNWCAYRKTTIQARECETNEVRSLKIIVNPYKFLHWESAGVDVAGEAGGRWYKLTCCSLSKDELMGGLQEIETSLVAAWNALLP